MVALVSVTSRVARARMSLSAAVIWRRGAARAGGDSREGARRWRGSGGGGGGGGSAAGGEGGVCWSFVRPLRGGGLVGGGPG